MADLPIKFITVQPDHVRRLSNGRSCIDCKHHAGVGAEHGCMAEALQDLVTGQPVYRDCRFMRARGACGPNGILWEKQK